MLLGGKTTLGPGKGKAQSDTRIDDTALSTEPSYPPPVTPAGQRVSGAWPAPFSPAVSPGWDVAGGRQAAQVSTLPGWLHVGLGRLPDMRAGASVHFFSSSLVPSIRTGP